MDFLYDYPNLLVGFGIVLVTVLVAVAGYRLFRSVFKLNVNEAERDLAMAVLAIVATVHSLLLAFSAVSVWESYSAAEASVVDEANTVAQLARDLGVYNSPESMQAREVLRTYVASVLNDEWPSLRNGDSHEVAWHTIDDLFRAIGRIEPDTPRHVALLPEIWQRTNELVKLRRDRLHASQSEIPTTLWTVVLVGTLLTFMTTWVLPHSRFNVWMISTLAFSIGLVFFFLVAMDRPFAGQESISPQPFQLALDNMIVWDKSSPR